MSTVSDKNKLLGVNFRKFTGVIVPEQHLEAYIYIQSQNVHVCLNILTSCLKLGPRQTVSCADPEGGTGGPYPPLNLKILPKKR